MESKHAYLALGLIATVGCCCEVHSLTFFTPLCAEYFRIFRGTGASSPPSSSELEELEELEDEDEDEDEEEDVEEKLEVEFDEDEFDEEPEDEDDDEDDENDVSVSLSLSSFFLSRFAFFFPLDLCGLLPLVFTIDPARFRFVPLVPSLSFSSSFTFLPSFFPTSFCSFPSSFSFFTLFWSLPFTALLFTQTKSPSLTTPSTCVPSNSSKSSKNNANSHASTPIVRSSGMCAHSDVLSARISNDGGDFDEDEASQETEAGTNHTRSGGRFGGTVWILRRVDIVG
jgi:hypothetical protein